MVAHTYISLPPIVDIWFRFLFHSPSGVLFTFPSRYLFTIGHQLVFSLTRWSGPIPTEFHVLHGTREYKKHFPYLFDYEAVTLFGGPFQITSTKIDKYVSKIASSELLYLTTPISQRTQAYTI